MASLAELWAKHASAPVSPGEAAAAAAARAAREEAQANEARRYREARTYLMSIWSIGEVRGAHRPSKEEALRRQQIPVLAREYANAGGEQSPKEWLLGDACRALCTAKGWHFREHGPADAAMQSAPASLAEAVATCSLESQATPPTQTAAPLPTTTSAVPQEPRQYDGANKQLVEIYAAYMHKWAADGSHVGWHTAEELVKTVEQRLFHIVPRANASRWLRAEKDRYAEGKGLRKRPDLVVLLRQLRERGTQKAAEDVVITEQPAAEQSVFKGHLVLELKKHCEEVIDIAGFGPDLVSALASQVYHQSLDEPVDSVWIPSPRWCYWFMHEHLGLVPRRIGSHEAASPEQVELQARLHQLNVEYVAIALSEGLPRKYIIGSDEFGMFLFPTGDYKWEKKGARHVASDLPDDKRQYTGACLHAPPQTCSAVYPPPWHLQVTSCITQPARSYARCKSLRARQMPLCLCLVCKRCTPRYSSICHTIIGLTLIRRSS